MGQVLRLAGGEGRAHREGGGGGAREGVGHRVQEGADQRLRVGEPGRVQPRERHRVPLGRQRGGGGPQVCDVLGIAGARPPGVVGVRRETGQEPAARDQVEGVQGGRAPAAGGGVGGRLVPGADEHGQRVGNGEKCGGHLDAPDPGRPGGRGPALGAGLPPDHGDLGRTVRHGVGRGPVVGVGRVRVHEGRRAHGALGMRVPEGEQAVPRDGAGQEDRRTAQQTAGVRLPRLAPARSTRTLSSHSGHPLPPDPPVHPGPPDPRGRTGPVQHRSLLTLRV